MSDAALVLLWDIDGTLLTTARAGVFAWEAATRERLGRPVDFSTLETAGLTDVEIAVRILARHGLDGSATSLADLLGRYTAHLPGCLPRRAGHVLPGVVEILEYLQGFPEVRSLLLTGNLEACARAKLEYFGLAGFFRDGAFSDGAPDRPTIARRAATLARRLLGAGAVPAEVTVVIGDTPHDIECARAIDARAVAVASGHYGADELRRQGAWWVLERLPSPVVFLERLRPGRRSSGGEKSL